MSSIAFSIFNVSYGVALSVGGLMHLKQGLAAVLTIIGLGVTTIALEGLAYVALNAHSGSRDTARLYTLGQILIAAGVAASMAHRFVTTEKAMPAIPIFFLSTFVALASLLRVFALAARPAVTASKLK
jgi:hypothetical protein